MIIDAVTLTPPEIDSTWPIVAELDGDPDFPFALKESGHQIAFSTAEAKALLKFLKKHLEPKLENV